MKLYAALLLLCCLVFDATGLLLLCWVFSDLLLPAIAASIVLMRTSCCSLAASMLLLSCSCCSHAAAATAAAG